MVFVLHVVTDSPACGSPQLPQQFSSESMVVSVIFGVPFSGRCAGSRFPAGSQDASEEVQYSGARTR
jgi:hypothetical protein